MIIETCPKCGGDLTSLVYTTYPPINAKHCYGCGYHWEDRPRPVIRVPFYPPDEDPQKWWRENFSVDNACEVKP